MKRVINLDNWNRKEHFKFFSALDDPFGELLRLLISQAYINKVKIWRFLFSLFCVLPIEMYQCNYCIQITYRKRRSSRI